MAQWDTMGHYEFGIVTMAYYGKNQNLLMNLKEMRSKMKGSIPNKQLEHVNLMTNLHNEQEKAHTMEWQLQDSQQPVCDRWQGVQRSHHEDHEAWSTDT